MKLWLRFSIALLSICAAPCANADFISVNFSENSANQAFAGGENIGPLASNSSNWNTTNGQPNLSAGTLVGLIDETGTATSANLTWSANNPWFNGDGTGSDEARLSVGYLDDGGSGISVTVQNIPYANYRVYGLYSSDQAAGGVIAQDMQVNGTWVFGGGAPTSISAYGSIAENFAANGVNWSLLTPNSLGNYWTIDTTGSTLTIIQSPVGDAGRAALSGFIIVDAIPEPTSMGVLAMGLVMFVSRRRRS